MEDIKLGAIALAAGRSVRMEPQNKLLLDFRGSTLLERSAETLKSLSLEQVTFVTGFDAEAVQFSLNEMGCEFVHTEEYSRGMHFSIQAGVQQLDPSLDAFMVYLCDQPLITTGELQQIIDGFKMNPKASLVVPSYMGQRGNPTIISMEYRDLILKTEGGDRGCRYLFQKFADRVFEVEMETESVISDIDTLQDLVRISGATH